MLNIRFTLDIGKNEPQEKVKNPCHKSDGDYSEQFRYLIRKQISEAIEKRTNSTLIGNVLEKKKTERSRRAADIPWPNTDLVYQ